MRPDTWTEQGLKVARFVSPCPEGCLAAVSKLMWEVWTWPPGSELAAISHAAEWDFCKAMSVCGGSLASALTTTAVLPFMRLQSALFPVKGVPCHTSHTSVVLTSCFTVFCMCICKKPGLH